MNEKTTGRTGSAWGLFAMALLLAVLMTITAGRAGAEVNPQPYDRVIIFGLDGAGAKIQEGKTPNFDRIFGDGAITYEARAPLPTVSAPGWGAMLYGVSGIVNGMDNDFAGKFHKSNKLYDSIFKLTKEAYPDAKAASFANWWDLNWGLIERDCGIYLYPDKQIEPLKEDITKKVIDWLEKNDPKLLFVYYGELDEVLHSKGFGSKEYMEEMTKEDEQIGLVYDELQKRGLLENTLILFVTDHGGDKKSHGGGTDGETKITFAAAGPRVEKQGTVEDMEIQDVAAIVLYALGIEQPENQTGRVPKGIFPGVGGSERKASLLTERYSHFSGIRSAETGWELTIPVSMASKVVYYEDFDGEVKGLNGKKELAAGLTGKGLNMRNSFLKTDIKQNAKWPGMSIGFWFRDEGYSSSGGDAVFVTDKKWTKGQFKGFMIALFDDAIQVNIGSGQAYRKDLFWNLPPDYRGKWVHCLTVFDQKTQTVRLYCDFVLVAEADMIPNKASNWVPAKEIFVGQDTSGKYSCWMNAEMDDLIIFNEALTPEEIEQIRVGYEPYITQ